jgi:hypothetical protein
MKLARKFFSYEISLTEDEKKALREGKVLNFRQRFGNYGSVCSTQEQTCIELIDNLAYIRIGPEDLEKSVIRTSNFYQFSMRC